METLQNLLTIVAEATVIVGITGIVAHALYSSHRNFMMEFCPPVAPYQPKVERAIAVDEVEQTVTLIASEQPEIEIDLTLLNPTALRKLCTKRQIAWRHARGKDRHATKAMMIHQLQQRLTA